MSLSDLAGKRILKVGRGFIHSSTSPKTYGFHPPGTEVLQLLLNLDWTAGQGGQLNLNTSQQSRIFTKKRKKYKLN